MDLNYNIFIAVCLLAYALGSVATAVWAGKVFHGIDVRDHGSGNAGATNTIRVLGWATGIPVLLIDITKGWLAASLPVFLKLAASGSSELINMQIITGIIAIIGHVFPVFAGFKGGKGVASTFGVLLALQPLVTLLCMAVFLAVLLITGYVSASSISAGLAFPLISLVFFDSPSLMFTIFALLVALALIITHRKNIRRLLEGEENRFIWKKRDSS
ncbi:MAG: glycerol-3-phosphate 1-O-acyltransferase PlsY [Bacteroidales bacterium]|nr:glycerol-3-phosphate 1-O-acyltransferase PlsY [Bacteroidales bacterium]